MKICRKCGSKYFGGEGFCSLDGEPLVDESEAASSPTAQDKPVSRDPFVGQRIEKYDIIERLGEGGMGEVYEARHVHIGKRVALKVLREDFSHKEEVVERFRQEARSATIIGHENIIDISDFGTTPDGRFFFVMEYLDGEDLASVFEKQRTIPYERALRILKQVCSGLIAAHEKGIIHRDLKPENIYLVHSGKPHEQAKILDFGIAKMSVLDGEGRKLTKTGVVFGTPEYMSPEQAGGKSVDHRIDIYAVGIIMFEMFTGEVPFTGDTFMSILTKHMFEPVPDMRTVNPQLAIPPAMQSIVMKALVKDPDERFGSMAELLAALTSVQEDPDTVPFDEPAAGHPRASDMTTPGPVLEVVGDVEDDEKPRRGKGIWIALAALLVLGILGAGVIFGLPAFTEIDPLASLTGGKHAGDDPTGADPGAAGESAVQPPATDELGENGPEETDTPPAADEAEPETVVLKVQTEPEGATVTAEGKGEICDSTPCEVTVQKDQELELTVQRGKVKRRQTVTASEDPTVLSFNLKPGRKSGKGPKKGGGDDKESLEDKPPAKKGGSVESGDLKIPSIYKKDK